MLMLQILFNHNNQQSILDLLSGVADIALGKADILSDMEVAGLITSMDLFKCITAVSMPSVDNSLSARMHVHVCRHACMCARKHIVFWLACHYELPLKVLAN